MDSELTKSTIDGLSGLRTALAAGIDSPDDLVSVADTLRTIGQSAADAGHDAIANSASLLAELVSLAHSLPSDTDAAEAETRGALIVCVSEAVGLLEAASFEEAACEHLQALCTEAAEKWGDYLDILESPATQTAQEMHDSWAELGLPPDTVDESADETIDASSDDKAGTQIDLILSTLTESTASQSAERMPSPVTPQSTVPTTAATSTPDAILAGIPPAELPDIEPELMAAYLDDATQCLASMESSLLDLERQPRDATPLKQICRDLHTLKGASASVELADLAKYLHCVEDYVTNLNDTSSAGISIDPLLQVVDTIRNQMAVFESPGTDDASLSSLQQSTESTSTAITPPRISTALPTEFDAALPPASAVPVENAEISKPAARPIGNPPKIEESLRVPVSRIDHLLDLLVELVILRNRSDSNVRELNSLNTELMGCANRLRLMSDQLDEETSYETGCSVESCVETASLSNRSNCVTEIATDITELARSARDLAQPLADENRTISRVLRQFRQELMELRRVPVADLFKRLIRATRDAARVEGKEVDVKLVGDQTGMERSLQDRLYEPLLHVVRNAVSHGIEPPDVRTSVGKLRQGTLTLEARSGANSLVILISDDGQGLDVASIRQRGIELGLLDTSRMDSESELYRLIFHPGFSTRREATAVSGRGIGMDVVATAMEALRGRIDVDSSRGRGTTIRLTIPLPAAIEHMMIVRGSDQLFGLPMHAIDTNTAGHHSIDDTPAHPLFSLQQLLSLPQSETSDGEMKTIAIRSSLAGDPSDPDALARPFVLMVDDILGPEEVVVRPMPLVLKRHGLFTGATLAGGGKTVLLFDSQRLVELADNQLKTPANDVSTPMSVDESPQSVERRHVLVVDDSLSARRRLVRLLQQQGLVASEAEDGVEALECLRNGAFSAVFTDLDMPNMNGLELLNEIRLGHQTASLPAVIVSSRNDRATRDRAAELDAAAYLTKPAQQSQVSQVLNTLELNHHSASGRAADDKTSNVAEVAQTFG